MSHNEDVYNDGIKVGMIEADPLWRNRFGSSLFTEGILPRTCSVSTTNLHRVVARAVDSGDAPDWHKPPVLIWPFLKRVAGASETTLHLSTSWSKQAVRFIHS